MAWKGANDDNGIYWASSDGEYWPQRVGMTNVGTTTTPSLVAVGPGLQRPSRNRVRCSRARHGVAARGRGPQLEVLYASTEADIATLVNIDQVYGTAGNDESVCRQHGQRLLWYVVVVFLRRTLVYVILIRMESNEV